VTPPIFVGRNEELARAREDVERACSAEGGLVVLTGEAGIGKTRLATEIAGLAAARGARVVWGRCWEAGGAPAYWPWLQALRALGVGDDPFAAPEAASAIDAQQIRFQQFERAAGFLKRAAAESALAIVLDDLHVADVPSLLLLQFIARDLRGTRLLVIATHREAEARSMPEVARLLAKISREGRASSLGRLGAEDVATWVHQASPDADAAAAQRIHVATEGNPLFVQELLRVRGAFAPSNLPDGLRTVIDEHVGRVSAETRELLAVASILGRDVDPAALAELSAQPADDVDCRLREALEAGLLASLVGGDRLAFFHILLRERLYSTLGPARRAELHWRAGERLLRDQIDLTTAAHHLLEGSAAGSMLRAAEVASEAATAAIARLAFEDAALICERALARLGPAAGQESVSIACDLEILLGEAKIRAGQSEAGKAACLRAAEHAKKIGSASRLARSALVYATELTTAIIDTVMIALLESALLALGDAESELTARVLARLAAALVPPQRESDIERIEALAARATTLARQLADEDTLLFVLFFVASARGYGVGTDERFAAVTEVVRLARGLRRPVLLLNASGWWIPQMFERGRLAEADAAIDSYATLVREFPQPHYRWRLPMLRSMRALLLGDFDAAEQLATEAFAIADRGDVPGSRFYWAMHRICIAHVRGEAASIARDAELVLSACRGGPAFSEWVHAAVGQTSLARAALVEITRLPAVFPLAIIGGDAATMIGDADLARIFYDRLRTMRTRQPLFWGPHGTIVLGPTARVAANLAAILGRIDEARVLYDEAIELAERMCAPAFVALARRARDALPPPADAAEAHPPQPPAPSNRSIELVREGDVWRITWSGRAIVLKDAKGLHYLERLLSSPGRELHVMELADMTESADVGPALDAKAKASYARRLEALRDHAEEARRFGDTARAAHADAEIDALAEELARAVGLGGRDRKLGSHVERARVNVQRRLRDVIKRVEAHDPELARYLDAALETGTFCSFVPL